MMSKGVIYKYTFPNGKIYIGQTVDLDKRHKQHLYYAKHAKGKRALCDIAIAKYGEPKLEVIEEVVEDSPSKFKKMLNEAETKWIKEYDATNKEIGYNIQQGGHTANEETYILEEIYLNILNEQKGKIDDIRKTLDSIVAKVEKRKRKSKKICNGIIFEINDEGYLTASINNPPTKDVTVSCICEKHKLNFTFLKDTSVTINSGYIVKQRDKYPISDVSFSVDKDELYFYKHYEFRYKKVVGKTEIWMGYGYIPNQTKCIGDSETFNLKKYNLTTEEEDVWFNLKFNYGYETTFDKLIRAWLDDDFCSGGDGKLYVEEFKDTVNQMFDYFEDDFKEKTWKYVNENKEKLIDDFFNTENNE